MKVINLPLLDCDSEEEYRKIFDEEFVGEKMVFNNYPLLIIKDDFYHIFFEKGVSGIAKEQFSLRRAKRMLFIKAICENSVPYTLLWEKEREDKEICVLCEQAETAIYLAARKSKGKNFLILKTLIAYGKGVTTKIERQKRMSVPIKNLDVVFEEAD